MAWASVSGAGLPRAMSPRRAATAESPCGHRARRPPSGRRGRACAPSMERKWPQPTRRHCARRTCSATCVAGGAGDELVLADPRSRAPWTGRVRHRRLRKARIVRQRLFVELHRGSCGLDRLALVGSDDDVAADRELVGARRMAVFVRFLAIGIEDRRRCDRSDGTRCRAWSRAGPPSRRIRRSPPLPARRRRFCNGRGCDPQSSKPRLAVMRDQR